MKIAIFLHQRNQICLIFTALLMLKLQTLLKLVDSSLSRFYHNQLFLQIHVSIDSDLLEIFIF